MATQTIRTCDAIDTCQEQVTALVRIAVIKDHTVLSTARLDSCNEHLAEVVADVWNKRSELVTAFNVEKQTEFDAMPEKQKELARRRGTDGAGWVFHGMSIDEY